MSVGNLSIDGEFRYIVQWFNEWSELQRDDFIPELVACLKRDQKYSSDPVSVNGIVNSMTNAGIVDKPMSIFQCRIKLFHQWTPKWSTELKHLLKEKIIEADPKVGEKVTNEMRTVNCVELCNGLSDGPLLNYSWVDTENAFPIISTAAVGGDTALNTDIVHVSTTYASSEIANTGTGSAAPETAPDMSLMEHAE